MPVMLLDCAMVDGDRLVQFSVVGVSSERISVSGCISVVQVLINTLGQQVKGERDATPELAVPLHFTPHSSLLEDSHQSHSHRRVRSKIQNSRVTIVW